MDTISLYNQCFQFDIVREVKEEKRKILSRSYESVKRSGFPGPSKITPCKEKRVCALIISGPITNKMQIIRESVYKFKNGSILRKG